MADELPRRATRVRAGGVILEPHGHAVLVEGVVHPLGAASMAVLRALAARPGQVTGRAEPASALPWGRSGCRSTRHSAACARPAESAASLRPSPAVIASAHPREVRRSLADMPGAGKGERTRRLGRPALSAHGVLTW
ncbi:hypothetical protein [Sinosporangium siamense]|uniref:hypothetical protein n=1 Tax=Sinosporangium siamense TaxID=1367973 RepID=UPI00194F6782|nr:hypothetical protein [Sinosporangium siamense]